MTPHIDLKTFIKIVHLSGLSLGLGGAVLLDIFALRFMVLQRISNEINQIFTYGTRIVLWGLSLLWLSGFSYLGYYAAYDPHSLSNPKMWAKLIIVVILTLNGYWIHHWILPLIRKHTGSHLFDNLTLVQRRILLTSSVISICSWFIPLFLGACKELNFCIPATTILTIYGCLIGLGVIFAWVMSKYINVIYEPEPNHIKTEQTAS